MHTDHLHFDTHINPWVYGLHAGLGLGAPPPAMDVVGLVSERQLRQAVFTAGASQTSKCLSSSEMRVERVEKTYRALIRWRGRNHVLRSFCAKG